MLRSSKQLATATQFKVSGVDEQAAAL